MKYIYKTSWIRLQLSNVARKLKCIISCFTVVDVLNVGYVTWTKYSLLSFHPIHTKNEPQKLPEVSSKILRSPCQRFLINLKYDEKLQRSGDHCSQIKISRIHNILVPSVKNNPPFPKELCWFLNNTNHLYTQKRKISRWINKRTRRHPGI